MYTTSSLVRHNEEDPEVAMYIGLFGRKIFIHLQKYRILYSK
jgi:hypothetical protein